MSILTKDFIKNRHSVTTPKAKLSNPIWNRYMTFAEKQEKEKVVWYLKGIIIIPCAIMVPSIYIMAMLTTNYVWFIGLTMVLFFANVIAHIGETKSTFYVPLYHASIAIMILIPLIKFLLTL